MRKLTLQIQCEDLAAALEDGLAEIDLDLGSPSDLIITGGSATHLLNDHPQTPITSADLSRNLEQEFQKALSARARFEKAEIAEDQEEVLLALDDAEICGMFGFEIGNIDAPTLLSSVPALKAAWERGWNEADFSAEMEELANYPEPDF